MSRVYVLLALMFLGLHLLATTSWMQSNIQPTQQPGATKSQADTPVAPVPPAKTGDGAESTPPLVADGSFDPGANGNVLTIAVQSDEKIVIGGDFTTVGGVTRNRIARLYSDGTVDPNFNPGANGTVYQILIQPDGKILIAGNFTMMGGGTGTTARSRIGRINPDGILDQYFVDSGANNAIYGMGLQSDGNIIIGGAFTQLTAYQGVAPFTYTVTRNFIAQLFPNGAVTDASAQFKFNPGANNSVFKVVVQPDDKVVLAGAFTTLGGGGFGTTTRNRIGRLTATGGLDAFNPGANNYVSALLRQSDGKIVVGGAFTGLGGGTGTTTLNHLGRLNVDGSLDTAFNPGANGDFLCLVQQTNGKILAGGNFTALGGGGMGSPSHNFIGRLNIDGSLDAGFNGGANGGVSAHTPNADGTIVVGGAFSTLGAGLAVARNRIGLLQPDGTVDVSVFPHNDNLLNAQVISGASGKIYGVNNGGTKETGEPQHAGQRGGSSVWYRWQSPFTGVVNFTTFGSDFDTILAAYTGTSVNALTAVPNGSNDDNTNTDNKDGHTLTSSISFSAVSGTTYYVAVDGTGGRSGAITLGWGPEASIGGQVSVIGYRVTVALVGDDSRAAFIQTGVGSYNFQHLRVGGKYQIFASSPNAESIPCVFFIPLNFSPLTQTVTNANFIDDGCRGSGASSISGWVRRSNGIGLVGIAVSITGTATRNLVTDSQGFYDASDLPVNGSYTVRPSSSLFVFNPTSRTFTNTGDILGADFVAGDSVDIYGQARRSDGTPIGGVTVTVSGTPVRSAQTDAQGLYSIGVPSGATYQLTAAKTGVNFVQPSLTLSNVNANQKNVDFVAATVTISGHVRNINGRGLSGERVDLTGSDSQTRTTDADGFYSFTVTSGGTYDVTPSDSRFQVGWSPSNSIHHANLTANATDDFEARTPSFTVAGVVKNTGGTNLSGVTIRLTGTFISGGNKVTLKDYSTTNGNYTSDALNIFGDYTFTPQTSTVSGTTYGSFNPTSRSFNSILPCSSVPGATCDNNTSTQNYLGADFTATATRVLTVASTNPASGVSITVSPNDNNDAGDGATQFTRSYNNSQVVNLTAPATASGNSFRKWQRDGADFGTTQSISVTMDANHTMNAIYSSTISGRVKNVNGRGLAGITVSCPSGTSCGSAVTDSGGNYSLVVAPGSYTLQASCLYNTTTKQCSANGTISVQFNPFTQVVNAQSNVTAQDFIAATPTFTVSGLVKNSSNTVFPNVTINVTGTNLSLVQITTDANGRYTATGLQYFGDYTLTPQTFTSGGTTYTNFTCNVIAACGNPPAASFPAIDHDYLNALDFTAIATRTLTVASTNPVSGVSITVSPNDNGNAGNGSTQFTRTYNNNQVVSLTAPPTAGGNNFQKWQKDGADFANNTVANVSVTMDANHIMTAVYVTPPRMLTVASSNPASGVSITVTPNDNSSQGSGPTQFIRTYNNNQLVSLTAPPTASGNNFQKWLKDGADFANNTVVNVSVTMDADHTMTAVYVTPKLIQLSSSSYSAAEDIGSKVITVTRTGDASGTAMVEYTTSDTAGSNCGALLTGKASSRCDYEATLGTLKFAAGETMKTISVPIIDDTYADGNEDFTVTLSNATGASLGSPSSATVTITDNDPPNGVNPIGDARYYVRVHYLDFLNREPDTMGWDFWTNQITVCGSDPGCIEVRRINVSASFFISIEFQQTGYLVERIYKVSYGNGTGSSTIGGTHNLSVPIVRLNEFLGDTQQITQGVVVLAPGWEQKLENNKVAFFAEFVQRSRFTTAFPTTLTPAQFVDQLFVNAGVTPSTADRDSAIGEFNSAPNTTDVAARGRALRKVAENPTLSANEFNRAFVLMQYFGYLRRNPFDPPEPTLDYSGYEFWLTKLNQFNGNYINAEMVKAFITSIEYKGRFGP